MNGSLENILLGVAANGLTAILASAGSRLLPDQRETTRTLDEMLRDGGRVAAETLEWSKTAPRMEEACLFLTSTEAESVVRQLFAARLTDNHKPIEAIRREFSAAFSAYVDVDEKELAATAPHLFDALLRATDDALNAAVGAGVLAAHEAKSTYRYQVLLDEIANVRKNVALLSDGEKPDVKRILTFERDYRRLVEERHSHIVPPHFDALRKVPVDDLYVPSDFVEVARQKGKEPNRLDLSALLGGLHRAVVLGHPGGGKSTLTLKICHSLANASMPRLVSGRTLTPILVVLRDYGSAKKSDGVSLLNFIETTSAAKYQLAPPASAFEYLLLNGRALVIFDGLDELLDTTYRAEVAADVESFCTLYPAVPVLVTSREVGYEQAPLSEKRFRLLRLEPFNDRQVADYSQKWFRADSDLTPQQQERKAAAFLEESEMVADLRANPLMLALMCNIYRGENYIPRNRPEVYEKCALMLFERWDKARGILVPLPFEAHISPAMKFLAHWIYSDEALQGGVSETELVREATRYLLEWCFEDREVAQAAARAFIDFCRGRAWVFTDTGTSRDGERLYQFTHRTFLEYFTAAHLVRTHSTPGRLGKFLKPRIERREWDVVAQLAMQLQNKYVQGAGDALIRSLLGAGPQRASKARTNRLSFAARSLEFMVPRPKLVRELTLATVDDAIRVSKATNPRLPHEHHRELATAPGSLLFAAPENRDVLGQAMVDRLLDRARSRQREVASRAREMGLYLRLSLLISDRGRPNSAAMTFCQAIEDRFWAEMASDLKAIAQTDLTMAYDLTQCARTGVLEMAQRFGLPSLFLIRRLDAFGVVLNSVASSLLNSFNRADEDVMWFFGGRRLQDQDLQDLGLLMLRSQTPWLSAASLRDSRYDLWHDFPIFDVLRPPPRWMFVAFGLFAPAFELALAKGHSLGVLNEGDLRSKMRAFLPQSFALRAGTGNDEETLREIEESGMSADQKSLVRAWATKQINLVGRKPPKLRLSTAP